MSRSERKTAKKALRKNITDLLVGTLIDPNTGIIKSSKKGKRIIIKSVEKLARRLLKKLTPGDIIVKVPADKIAGGNVSGEALSPAATAGELKPAVAASKVKTATLSKKDPKTRRQPEEV